MCFVLGAGSKAFTSPLGWSSAKAVRMWPSSSILWCPRSRRCTPAETSAPPSSRPATCSKPPLRPERFFLALESLLSNLTQKEAELLGPLRGLRVRHGDVLDRTPDGLVTEARPLRLHFGASAGLCGNRHGGTPFTDRREYLLGGRIPPKSELGRWLHECAVGGLGVRRKGTGRQSRDSTEEAGVPRL